jgi:SAM-dependent methyltransferase
MGSEQGYTEEYYKSHLDKDGYIDNPAYVELNRRFAENLKKLLMPERVLDVGCACGYLVSAFRDIGVSAYGVDPSEYALKHVRTTSRKFCRKAALPELKLPGEFPQKYDLATCIEVLEHIPETDTVKSVQALTRLSDAILFSSSPDDLAEETHVNAHPLSYWCEKFAENGYFPDVRADLSFGPPQFILFRKSGKAPSAADLFAYMDTQYFTRMVKAKELSDVAAERYGLIKDYQAQLAAKDAEIAKMSGLANERLALVGDLRAQVTVKDAEIAKMSGLANERLALVGDLRSQAAVKDAEIEKLAELANERLSLIGDLRAQLAAKDAKDAEIAKLAELANERLALVGDFRAQLAAKDAEIEKLAELANERLALVGDFRAQLAAKDAEIEKLAELAKERLSLIGDFRAQLAAKDAEIEKQAGAADEQRRLVEALRSESSETATLHENLDLLKKLANDRKDLVAYGESVLAAYRDFQSKLQSAEEKKRALAEEISVCYDQLSRQLEEFERVSQENELGRQELQRTKEDFERVSRENESRRQEIELLYSSRAYRLALKIKKMYNLFSRRG